MRTELWYQDAGQCYHWSFEPSLRLTAQREIMQKREQKLPRLTRD